MEFHTCYHSGTCQYANIKNVYVLFDPLPNLTPLIEHFCDRSLRMISAKLSETLHRRCYKSRMSILIINFQVIYFNEKNTKGFQNAYYTFKCAHFY